MSIGVLLAGEGAKDRRTLVKMLACGKRLGPSDQQANSFGSEVGFSPVAVFSLIISGCVWCPCPGWEQSGVPVALSSFTFTWGIQGLRFANLNTFAFLEFFFLSTLREQLERSVGYN